MPGVGIKNERRIRDVLLKDKGVDARYHDVVLPIHDEDRLLDFLELTISIRFGDHAPASNRCCLGTHGRHRRRHILVSARVTTLPKGAAGCLACLARREEKVEKILDACSATFGVKASILSPPCGPVPVRTTRRIKPGFSRTTCWATNPPSENPSKSTRFRPSTLMNVTTCFAMPETVSAGSPSELATPALLNRMTGRSFARPSVTLGSQLSSPPRKCCKNTTGVPVLAPNRLYAYLTPLASRNCVGVVLCEFVISRLP